jgi:hypothetical protein
VMQNIVSHSEKACGMWHVVLIRIMKHDDE